MPHPPRSNTPRRTRPTARCPLGYTLVEALVTLAVLALLATAAWPSYRSFVLRRQLDGAATQLGHDLQWLRQASVARNQALRISFRSSSAGSCYLVHSGDATLCDCVYDGAGEARGRCQTGAELLRAQAWPTGTLSVRANITSMRVDPRQGSFSPTGSIDLQAGDGPVLRHVVNLLGRVRLCAPQAGPTIAPGVTPC